MRHPLRLRPSKQGRCRQHCHHQPCGPRPHCPGNHDL